MKEKFQRFMIGRYGVDRLSLFMTYGGMVLLLALTLTKNNTWSWIPLVLVVLSYVRVFSKNRVKMAAQNQKYLEITSPLRQFFGKMKRRFFGGPEYKYFDCPKCRKELRVPKGKGKINIKCPNCTEEFIKKT